MPKRHELHSLEYLCMNAVVNSFPGYEDTSWKWEPLPPVDYSLPEEEQQKRGKYLLDLPSPTFSDHFPNLDLSRMNNDDDNQFQCLRMKFIFSLYTPAQ